MLYNFDVKKDSFDEIYNIMQEAFHPSETRIYENQKALLNNSAYSLKLYKNEQAETIAFVALWELDDFIFVEHLAVLKQARGGGIGDKIMSELILQSNKPVVLEVEPPENEISKRRIEFYKRLGFVYNSFDYKQPPMRNEFDFIKLNIMTYPQAVSEQAFSPIKKQLYECVYNINLYNN